MNLNEATYLEQILYILNRTRGLDHYHLFKVLYFAERAWLALWGRKLVADEFFALPYGPVPSRLYDVVKGKQSGAFAQAFWRSVDLANEDAPNVLLPLRPANTDYLAPAELEVLNEAIDSYAYKSFAELCDLSHTPDWEIVAHTKGRISPIDTARVGGASPDLLSYLQEQLDWDDACAFA